MVHEFSASLSHILAISLRESKSRKQKCQTINFPLCVWFLIRLKQIYSRGLRSTRPFKSLGKCSWVCDRPRRFTPSPYCITPKTLPSSDISLTCRGIIRCELYPKFRKVPAMPAIFEIASHSLFVPNSPTIVNRTVNDAQGLPNTWLRHRIRIPAHRKDINYHDWAA